MSWNISAWSIRHPVPTIVLFLVLTVAGLAGFRVLGIAADPDVNLPTVSVVVTQPGAAPVELETQVTRRIEDAVAGIGNVRHITSTVADGYSRTSVEFLLGTSIDRATSDVRDAVAKIRSQLPQGIDEPSVRRVDEQGGPFLGYSVTSKRRSATELSWLVDNRIARAILAVPGVSRVSRFGGVDREVRLDLDPNRLKALGLTVVAVQDQLRALNVNLPGGRGQVGASEQAIRTLGSALSVAELAEYRIALPDGGFVPLAALGRLHDGAAEPRQLAYIDGKPAVNFEVARSVGANLVAVEEAIRRKVEELERELPEDIDIPLTWTLGDFVRESYDASVEALLLGAALAVVVVWLFLRDWRSTLIAALAMPLSVIPTFAVIRALGFNLNNMTLLALALVVGILVDDAIVEIENIVRHIAMGKSPYQAAIDAADEIGLAVVATTMTIVAVFLPVAFMGGIQGLYYREFGWTVVAAVLFSLAVARMLTPLMAAYLLKPVAHSEEGGPLVAVYEKLLGFALARRWLTLALAAGVFAGSVVLLTALPTALIGPVDDGQSTLTLELPPGSSLAAMGRVSERVNALILARPEVARLETDIGAWDGSRKVNLAHLYISLTPKSSGRISKQEVQAALRTELARIPGLRFSFSGSSWDEQKTLRIVLKGDDPLLLARTAADLTDQMRALPDLVDVTSDAAIVRPEIRVRPDLARAAEQGVTVAAIARTASVATLGDNDARLARFNLPDRQVPIRVQLAPRFRTDLEAIGELLVPGSEGEAVPLKAVASLELASGPVQLDRFDRARQVTVGANLAPGIELGPALQAVHRLPALATLPPGISEQLVGDAENQRDVFDGFGWAIAAAVLLIYAVLVLLFGGFLQPLTIMVSLPLSLGGAALGLLAFGKALGLYALIGIVLLMGLVCKNAILLVEYCLMAMGRGVPRAEAVRSAGRSRLRPILMTTFAMVAGMLPIALGIGAGAEVRSPMAVAVVGGLATSTLLTLVVVPVLFTVIDDLQGWLTGRIRRDALTAPAQQE